MSNRDTYKYYFKDGNKIIHVGITDDLERREREHQRELKPSGHIEQIGNRTTREKAIEWENKQRKAGKPTERK